MGIFKKYPAKDFSIIDRTVEKADFVLYHNMKPDFIGDGIEWFTRSIGGGKKASHVDMYVGGGDVIGYTIGGCKKMRLDRYYKNHMKIYVLRIKGLNTYKQTGMYDAAHNDLKNTRLYDYVSYTGFLFMCMLKKLGYKNAFSRDNPLQGSGKVCSTGGDVWAARGAGIDIFPDVGDESVTPHHYFESSQLDLIAEV